MTSGTFSTSYNPVSVTLLGCGKMGSSMLHLWLDCEAISQAHVIDPSPLPKRFKDNSSVTYSSSCDPSSPITSDLLILAVKPQILDEALAPIKQHISPECCVLSIVAGKDIDTLSSYFDKKQPIMRVMPNTPASIGQGASVAIANKMVSSQRRQQVSALLEYLGSLHWIEDETLMNAVTALSGSGPAYVFYLIEVLSKAGCNIGLPQNIAEDLARQTVIGSAALAGKDNDIPAATLRQNVTSSGGTTQAALDILMDGRLESLFHDALKAARIRSKELNG